MAAASCIAAVAVLLWQNTRPHDPADLTEHKYDAAQAQAAAAAEPAPEAKDDAQG